MKKLIGVLICVCVLAGLGHAGPKAVKDFNGSKTLNFTLEETRDTGTVSIRVSDIGNKFVFDRMTGVIQIDDLIGGIGPSDTGNTGALDTFIVILMMNAFQRTDTLRVDTAFPGDSGYIKYDFYRQAQTTTTTHYALDSGGVATDSGWFVNTESVVTFENVDWLSVGLNNLALHIVWADSAGVVDTGHTGTFNYWFRFFDED